MLVFHTYPKHYLLPEWTTSQQTHFLTDVTHFWHLFFLYDSPAYHIKFLRPCCLCLLLFMFSLQLSFKLMFKLSVNLPDRYLLPSVLSKHNKSHQLCGIQEDSGCLVAWMAQQVGLCYTSAWADLIFSVVVKLSFMSRTSTASGQQIKLLHLDILPSSDQVARNSFHPQPKYLTLSRFCWRKQKYHKSTERSEDKETPGNFDGNKNKQSIVK